MEEIEEIRKFARFVSPEKSNLIEKLNWEHDNEAWLDKSSLIAIQILIRLDELGMNKTDLALKLRVSQSYVSKLVKGSENLTLETILKLEKVLGLKILTNLKPEYNQKWIMSSSFKQINLVGAWCEFNTQS